MSQEQKQHYFLVAGEIIFTTPAEKGEEFHQINMNAILTSDTRNLKVSDLGRAQQYLQMAFLKGVQVQPDIKNVILLNLKYLGQFTEEEFFDDNKSKNVKTQG